MRNLSELNINEGGKPVARPAPSADLLEAFQSETGLKVPPGLRHLLQYANGGHPELDSVGCAQGQFAVNTFFNLTSNDFGPESLWYAVQHWGSILGKTALSFAEDGGGNQFFLDFSKEPPSVKLCLHDEAMRTLEIAPTFEAFIDSLSIDPDMI
jgi:hypothetical protein